MKTFIKIGLISLIMVFSVVSIDAAKANHDRTKATEKEAADKVKKEKKKLKDGGGEHQVSWGTNARAAKDNAKTRAIDHNASRSNTTASKIQPDPKKDKKNAKKKNCKKKDC